MTTQKEIIPRGLLKKAEAVARKRGITVSQVIEEAILRDLGRKR